MFVTWTAPEQYESTGQTLEEFLRFFHPATDLDRSLLRVFVLTLFWGGPPGQRPLFVIGPAESHQHEQEIGKSELARNCAELVGGCMELTMPRKGGYGDDLPKQIVDPVNMGRRVVLLDNTTGTLRDDKLTDLVTAKQIEGRASHAKRSRRLNLLTWVVTTNELSLSADLASRAVVIRLNPCDREARPNWIREIGEFIWLNADKIAADCVALLRSGPRNPVNVKHTRFPTWDQDVLSVSSDVNEMLILIRERVHESNSDAKEVEEFLRVLRIEHPASRDLRLAELCAVWEKALGKSIDVGLLGRVLRGAMNRGLLPGLRPRSKRNGAPWVWEPYEYGEGTSDE